MKTILYGTTNSAKLKEMKDILKGMDINVIGLKDLDKEIPNVIEDGKTHLENARKKAETYFKVFKIPVFSCDSELYIEGLKDIEQPGVHVRRINGKELSDSEMIAHYSNIAKNNGGEVIAYYENAMCLVLSENTKFQYQGPEISYGKFIISEKPCEKKISGFPLDSLSKNIKTNKYHLEEDEVEEDNDFAKEWIRSFFKENLKSIV